MQNDSVQFLNLKRFNSQYRADFIKSFEEFLDRGHYILGEGVAEFEKSFATYTGAKYCLGVANGLDALILILRGLMELGHLKVGDEVIVPANTFIATVLAVNANQLTPVFVDPDETSFNLTRMGVEKALTPKTKVVLGVHLYGQLCDVQGISALCQERGLLFVEDAAQAHGASLNNVSAGAFGVAAGFSFYPGKNLGALGDAGAITTSHEDLFEIIKKLRNYGSSIKYHHEVKGYNSRLDELQALFLQRKLLDLNVGNTRRRHIAKRYQTEITNPQIKLPQLCYSEMGHVWHLFVIRVQDRKTAVKKLEEKGIVTLIHYPVIPTHQKAYSEFSDQRTPLALQMQDEILSLPIDPSMTDDEVTRVIDAVNQI